MSPLPASRAQQALVRALHPAAGAFTLLAASSRDWSSATFEGVRHRLALRLEGDDARERATRLVALLPDAELSLPGAFVADIVVTASLDGDAPVLGIEALTIRDAIAEARALSGGVRRCG